MAKKMITLYIDDTSLRLLVTRGKRIIKWADLPLEPGLFKSNVVIKEAEAAAKIKQLLKAQKVKAKKVIVGLSGLHCLSRPIILPRLPKTMLDEAVIREAKRVLPTPVEQLYISWQTIPPPEGKIKVFLVAIPRKTADALVKMLRRAGLNPYLMDLKPLALARVVKKATAVIVDVQPTEFDIVIMADGVPQPMRTISLPSETLSWQAKLPMIRDELDRTIKFYNSNNPEPLDSSVPIYVSGELAHEPELCKSLSDELGHSVLSLSSPLKCPNQFDPTRYLVNIGLALKELPSEREAGASVANLSILPVAYRPKPFSLTKVLVPLSTIVAIGLLIPLATLVQNAAADTVSQRVQLDATNQFLKQRQAKQQSQRKEIDELEKQVAELEITRDAFASVLHDFSRQQEIANGDLKVATSTLPSTVDLVSITRSSAGLTISGKSPSEAEVLLYASSLGASGRFSETIIAHMKKIEDEGVDFALVLKTRG